MLICNKCKKEQQNTDFDKNRTICKQCRRDYIREWRHERGKNKRYIGEPKENLVGQKFGMLTIVEINPQRKHHQFQWNCLCDCGKSTTVITGHIKSGNVRSCGCLVHRRKTESPNWKGTGEMSAVRWHIMKNKAKARGLEFKITPEYVWNIFELQKGKCALSGVELDFGTHKEDYGIASLDRIDSDKGYIKGNIQWVHRDVNFMKQSMSDNDLIDWCRKIIIHKKIQPYE